MAAQALDSPWSDVEFLVVPFSLLEVAVCVVH